MTALTYRAALNAPLLEADEERDAIRRWQQAGDRAALELLMCSHARQVHAQAQKWTSNPAELEDLVAEGMIGLMRAADLFDLDQDVRFATYAHWWILTCVSTALARMRSLVDIPQRTYLDATKGRLTGEDRELVMQALQGRISLDAPVFDESVGQALDMLRSPEMTPEERVEAESTAEMLRALIEEALEELGDPDREIVLRRKLHAVPESIEDISQHLGISRDRARMVERRAMARLKLWLVRRGFSPAMLN